MDPHKWAAFVADSIHFKSASMSWTSSHKWLVRNGNKDTLDESDLVELAHYLAEESSLHALTSTGASLVHFAALTAHPRILIKFLHRQGANIHATDEQGATPLHWAVQNSSKEAFITLLALGASPLAVDYKLNTPLHYAAGCGNIRAAKGLMSLFPPALCEKNVDGRTPLAVACAEEHSKMIRFLLSAGAPFEEQIIELAITNNSRKVVKAVMAHVPHERWSMERKNSLLSEAKNQHKGSVFRALRKVLNC